MDFKNGKNTSEFALTLMPWIAFFGLLVLVGIGRVELLDIQWVLLGLGIGGGAASGKYSESRGIVKAEALHGDALVETAMETQQAALGSARER